MYSAESVEVFIGDQRLGAIDGESLEISGVSEQAIEPHRNRAQRRQDARKARRRRGGAR
jgi:hypothetical protein